MEPQRATSPWVAALAVASVLVLLVTGGMAALRSILLARMELQTQHSTTTIEQLTARLDTLDRQLAAMANATPDTSATDAMHQQLADAQAQVSALVARVEVLEKAPVASIAPTPLTTPVPPAAIATPIVAAPSEAELMQQFQTIVKAMPVITVREEGVLTTLNERMNGLVSIHKSTTDTAMLALRKASTVDEARAAVLMLPIAQRAPFSAWLTQSEPHPAGAL